jgi:hypothetical protein
MATLGSFSIRPGIFDIYFCFAPFAVFARNFSDSIFSRAKTPSSPSSESPSLRSLRGMTCLLSPPETQWLLTAYR